MGWTEAIYTMEVDKQGVIITEKGPQRMTG
jgi:hypothetical protein